MYQLTLICMFLCNPGNTVITRVILVATLIYFSEWICVSVFAHVTGVLWLSVISEFTYIGLLGMGFLLMWLEVLCSHKEMHSLKINAYAAICTVLSGEYLPDGHYFTSPSSIHSM